VPRKTSNLTRPPQTDPIHAARGSLRHPGWLRRNHRLASVGTGGWFQSESLAVFIGIRTWIVQLRGIGSMPLVNLAIGSRPHVMTRAAKVCAHRVLARPAACLRR
jgi:hypothetical protein